MYILKKLLELESDKNSIPQSDSISFVDCGEADINQTDIKLEIKEENETPDVDPLSIKMEADNVEESVK